MSRTEFEDAIDWMRAGPEILVYLTHARGTEPHVVPPTGVTAPSKAFPFALVDEDGEWLPDHGCTVVGVRFATTPADVDAVVRGWLEAALDAGALFAWCAFDASFDFRHILDPDAADSVYAVAIPGRIVLALDDDERRSTRWAQTLRELRQSQVLPLMAEPFGPRLPWPAAGTPAGGELARLLATPDGDTHPPAALAMHAVHDARAGRRGGPLRVPPPRWGTPPSGTRTTSHACPRDPRTTGSARRRITTLTLDYPWLPHDCERVARAWLDAAVGAGASLAWFGAEARADDRELLSSPDADSIWAAAGAGRVLVALDDDYRASTAWADQLLALRAEAIPELYGAAAPTTTPSLDTPPTTTTENPS